MGWLDWGRSLVFSARGWYRCAGHRFLTLILYTLSWSSNCPMSVLSQVQSSWACICLWSHLAHARDRQSLVQETFQEYRLGFPDPDLHLYRIVVAKQIHKYRLPFRQSMWKCQGWASLRMRCRRRSYCREPPRLRMPWPAKLNFGNFNLARIQLSKLVYCEMVWNA